jgi:hypothetical protein
MELILCLSGGLLGDTLLGGFSGGFRSRGCNGGSGFSLGLLHLLFGDRGCSDGGDRGGCTTLTASRGFSDGALVGGLGVSLAHFIPDLTDFIVPGLELFRGFTLGNLFTSGRDTSTSATTTGLEFLASGALEILEGVFNLGDTFNEREFNSVVNRGGGRHLSIPL